VTTDRPTPRPRRTWILILGVLAALALAFGRPWADAEPTEERLRARVATYAAHRKAAAWDELYAMVDPRERAAVSRERFMSFYAQDVTRLRSLRVVRIRSAAAGTATVDVEVEHELVPERLPAGMRRTLDTSDPQALVQKGEVALEWSWHGGDWHFRMDRVVLTGRDPKGRLATPGTGGDK
jgi:hypothetical protein